MQRASTSRNQNFSLKTLDDTRLPRRTYMSGSPLTSPRSWTRRTLSNNTTTIYWTNTRSHLKQLQKQRLMSAWPQFRLPFKTFKT